ncbi:hypothetical protein MWU59_12200 [Flavobacteriaceae bacterium F08102]|nr:hypothetical protein [Flavobacteriaceae bacterium F08102]
MEDILSKKYNEINFPGNQGVSALIRVLSRISTIPKIDDINIRASKTFPYSFRIVPGKLLVIGEYYMTNPVLALIYLRYGIEWQIWFQAFDKNKKYAHIYDVAALNVLMKFYQLLPIEDKMALQKDDARLADFLNQTKGQSTVQYPLADKIKAELASFHKITIPQIPANDAMLQLVEGFAQPTEFLLMSGGDFRLQLSEKTLLNKYGCTPFPRPQAFTFASSTATSISNYAFDITDRVRRKLIRDGVKQGMEKTGKNFILSLKKHLIETLKIEDPCEVIFSPSGTDSSLQIAALTQIATDKPIVHIVVGSDETGSGVPTALKGYHFENNTALHYPVKKGDPIRGFRPVEVQTVAFRDKAGVLKKIDRIDNEVLAIVDACKQAGKHIVLHVIDQSKLGYRAPSSAAIKKVQDLKDISAQIVIDGSQFRFDAEDIGRYLKHNFIVTITGSKFFTGPPYSGALLIPTQLAKLIRSKKCELPIGLTEYFNKSDWPVSWDCIRTLADGTNFGALMRWNAAISEMHRYFDTPILYRNLGIELFCDFVRKSVKESEFLDELFIDDYNNVPKGEISSLKTTRTIFPFFISKNGKVLSQAQVKKIYELLNANLSTHFEESPIEVKKLAAQKCHIGQAVSVIHPSGEPSAVLRISLGARVISESWKDRDVSLFFRNIEEQMNQITIIIKKIELILNHNDLLV